MLHRPSWDDTFLDICNVIAKRSKDINTKFGCVIVGPGHELRTMGYNCFPRGCNDNIPERQLRPEKYYYMEHAERNAIYNAARMGVSLIDCVCYVQGHPCADCARALIQSGVKEIVCASNIVPERFLENCNAANQMLSESGIDIRLANTTTRMLVKPGTDWCK